MIIFIPDNIKKNSINNPQLLLEWDYNKNIILPLSLTNGSEKKVWWKCENGHSWFASIYSRAKLKSNCPFCSGRCATIENNLSKKYPELLKEWDYSNNIELPENVTPKSNKTISWKCKHGHQWKTSICNRTQNKTNCPYCQGLYKTEDQTLKHLYPKIFKDIDLNKNVNIDLNNLAPKSHKKIWWKCQKNHGWYTSIASRTSMFTGCPYCTGTQSSKLERRVYCELNALIKDVLWKDKSFGFELDIYIPKFKLSIEIDGAKWHNSIEKDIKKNQRCIDHNIILIRVRQEPLTLLGKYDFNHKKGIKYQLVVENLVKIINSIIESDYHYHLNNCLDNQKYLEISP